MAPASKADINKQVAALSPVMKRRNLNDQTTEAVLATYEMDLADQPLFALMDACTAYRRMLVGSGFMPLPGELLTEAKKKAEWLQVEAYEIDRILNAEIKTEHPTVERASMRARLEALKATLKSARAKNEIARGYMDTADLPKETLSPAELLKKTVEAYSAKPVTLSSEARGNRFRSAA